MMTALRDENMTHYLAEIKETPDNVGIRYEITINKQIFQGSFGFKLIPYAGHSIMTVDRKNMLDYLRQNYLIDERDSVYYKVNGGSIYNLGKRLTNNSDTLIACQQTTPESMFRVE